MTENAKIVSNHPSLKIQIEGHCDERGSNEYNLALGERRATSAKLYLIKLGVPENRLSTISYGEERPLDPGHNEEAWAKNRRCHFVILSR
jgi:peptidoglycan-associated lipoprotein